MHENENYAQNSSLVKMSCMMLRKSQLPMKISGAETIMPFSCIKCSYFHRLPSTTPHIHIATRPNLLCIQRRPEPANSRLVKPGTVNTRSLSCTVFTHIHIMHTIHLYIHFTLTNQYCETYLTQLCYSYWIKQSLKYFTRTNCFEVVGPRMYYKIWKQYFHSSNSYFVTISSLCYIFLNDDLSIYINDKM